MTRSSAKLLAAVALLAASASITAPLSAQETFDFANLKSNNLAGSFTPTVASRTACSGGDFCGPKGGALSFEKGIFTVDAYGFHNGAAAMAVQDHENGYNGNLTTLGTNGAGLGVYHKFNADGVTPSDKSDDNITFGEKLHLSFDQIVNMESFGLRSEGHNTSWTANAVFQYSLDNSTWFTETLVGSFALNQSSKDFYFRFADDNQLADQYYLSSVTVRTTDFFQVPEPASIALLSMGLLSLGVVSRRRARQNA